MDPVSIILTTVGWLANPIFKMVADVAWQQFTKRVGLQAEIDDMIAELKSFKVPIETAETKEYLKEVKGLISEAKDLLDELDYFRLQDEVKQKNKAEQGNIFSKLKSPSPSDVPSSSTEGTFKELKFDKKGMSKRMKELIKKLKRTYESLNPTIQHQLLSSIVQSIQTVNNQALPTNRHGTTSYSLEDKIYGRDGEIEQIKNLINHGEQDSQKLSVISLVGHGGMGKTTLAQQLFNHPTIEFDQKIWICVSTNLDGTGITRQILQCCSPSNISYDNDSNEDLLKRKLEEYFKDKKFLLVLDDIWEMSETEWKSLLAPLKMHTATNKTGSMVLVTTRNPSIAKMVSTTEPIYINKLDNKSLWSFFIKCAFGDDRYNVPGALENFGRRIVERLSGNPLAIKTVGNLLKGENDPTKWAKVLESEQWKFVRGKDDIMPILRLSYENLSIHLRQCFSYCSIFPKDHYFVAEDLVYMWMAQDFICTNNERVNSFHQNKDKRVEDVGFEYLKILVERAFFQKVVEEEDEKYVIHDLMHDLAQAVSSEEILAIDHPDPIRIPPSVFHLSFLLDTKYTIENHVQFQNLSSLVIFENNKAINDTLNWDQANRIRLHLLILPYKRSISYNFNHFTHLRYLKIYLNFNNIRKDTFPVQICRLYHLQVLEFVNPWIIFSKLPKEFNNLVNLRHFIANEELHSKIAGVGRLRQLQELKQFGVREEKGFELGQLSELKELRGSLKICSLENAKNREEAERVKLSDKKIVNLHLSWDIEYRPRKNREGKGKWRTWLKREGKAPSASSEEILEALRPNSELKELYIEKYGGCRSPAWLTNHSIKYLEFISILNCEAWEELPNFGQLMCLKELYLSNLPKVKAFRPQFHGCGPQEGFPCLKVMYVTDMNELETWVWSKQRKVFPSLESLTVKDCPVLREFSFLDPISDQKERTEWFPKLHKLKIENCPQLQQAVSPKIIPYIYTSGITEAYIDGGSGGIEYSRLEDDLNIHNVKEPENLALLSRTFKNISSMTVDDCANLTSLSWESICMINSLKYLTFKRCHELCFSPTDEQKKDDGRTIYSHESLEVLKITECGVTGEELSYLLAHLPAICQLSIENCHEIDSVSLPGIIDGPNRASLEAGVEVNKHQQRSPDSLMRLEELYITNCRNMVFINEGGLSGLNALTKVAIRGSEKLLYSMNQKEGSNSVHTLKVEQSNVTSLKLYSFVALRKLFLSECKHLASVEGPNSPACPKVHITNCPKLAQTQSQIEPKFLMPVRELVIDNIEFLSIHTHISMSLHNLTLFIPTIHTHFIPCEEADWNEWTVEQEIVFIKHLTALEELSFRLGTHLRSLPSTLHLHPSLKELTIINCPFIEFLPQRGLPKTLQKLRIGWNCSKELKSQCSQLRDFECSTETEFGRIQWHVFLRRNPLIN